MSGTGTDYGNDVIASVNGQIITGEGLNLRPRTAVLDADITLAAAFGSVATGGTSTFGVTGGGALFQISPTLNLNGQATLGIDSLSTASLGEANIGWLYEISSGEQYDMSTSRYFTAQRIVRRALQQVATLRGRLGSFHKNILQTASNALAIQYENVAAAESVLRDTDFAQETSNLTRSQILVQSATNVLRIANAQPQQVLSLLG
jgi:flagellin